MTLQEYAEHLDRTEPELSLAWLWDLLLDMDYDWGGSYLVERESA